MVGIDVGGLRKGFHCVALREGRLVGVLRSLEVEAVVRWCRAHRARVIAIDSPCLWSSNRNSRVAERELSQAGISCFSTPTLQKATAHTKGFYGWVFNGMALFEALRPSHPLLNDQSDLESPLCIETFPHAIECALRGEIASAKTKTKSRRALLRELGLDSSELTNIDFVDAALCAVAAEHYRVRKYRTYGDSREGFIVVPQSSPLTHFRTDRLL